MAFSQPSSSTTTHPNPPCKADVAILIDASSAADGNYTEVYEIFFQFQTSGVVSHFKLLSVVVFAEAFFQKKETHLNVISRERHYAYRVEVVHFWLL